jgi:hypothetical protein
MKNINKLVYLLLFCILLQNNVSIIDFFKRLSDSKNHLSLFLKDSNKAPSEEEENEKESKENENKENENKEKEKELKNIKYFSSFEFLSVSLNTGLFRNVEDAKLFSLNSDTETPPPKTILAV